MPHFTLDMPAGPVVRLAFAVSDPYAEVLKEAGQPVPERFIGYGLVDTGASCSAIDPIVIKSLSLKPTGKMQLHTPSTGDAAHTANTYDVAIGIWSTVQEPPLWLPSLAVFESELYARQQIHSLLGRDILERCVLIYNGTMNQFTLSF